MRAEQITGPVAHHGEGPVWSPSWGGLRWVDMTAGEILSFDARCEVQRRSVGSPVAAVVRPRRGGGAVTGVERGFALEEPDGAIRLPI
jgi:sugar lactone lactonase YvrE